MNRDRNTIHVVYVDGIPRVFSNSGEELKEGLELEIKSSAGEYHTIKFLALCNVYNSIQEMRKFLGLND